MKGICGELPPFPKTVTATDDVLKYWGLHVNTQSRQVAGSYWPTAAQFKGTVAGWSNHELLGLAF